MPAPASSPSPNLLEHPLGEPDPFVRQASNAVVATVGFYAAALAEHEAEVARANALTGALRKELEREQRRVAEVQSVIAAGRADNERLAKRVNDMGQALGDVGRRYRQLQHLARTYLSASPDAEGYAELRVQLELAVTPITDDRNVDAPAAPAHPDPVRAEADKPGDWDA